MTDTKTELNALRKERDNIIKEIEDLSYLSDSKEYVVSYKLDNHVDSSLNYDDWVKQTDKFYDGELNYFVDVVIKEVGKYGSINMSGDDLDKMFNGKWKAEHLSYKYGKVSRKIAHKRKVLEKEHELEKIKAGSNNYEPNAICCDSLAEF